MRCSLLVPVAHHCQLAHVKHTVDSGVFPENQTRTDSQHSRSNAAPIRFVHRPLGQALLPSETAAATPPGQKLCHGHCSACEFACCFPPAQRHPGSSTASKKSTRQQALVATVSYTSVRCRHDNYTRGNKLCLAADLC